LLLTRLLYIGVLCLNLSVLCGQESNCGDGIDNDGDGLIDCYDGDCQGVAGCEDFFFNPPVPVCGFMPPELDEIELNLLYQTDEALFPIDQRAGVVVGDLDGDGIAELISRDNNPARIQIFDGATGEIKQSIVTPGTHPFGQIAIADVDENGLGDMFHLENNGILARYEFGNPNAVWRTANGIGDDNNVTTPQIADINQDGIPEVYVGDRIFDAITGIRYVDGDASVNVGGYATGGNSDRFPIYYDLFEPGDPRPDGTGTFGPEAAGLEYIAGNQVWTVDFTPGVANSGSYQLAAEYSGPTNLRDGLTSIADINGDGRMDIAVMDAGDVYAWDPYTNEIIGSSYQVPNTTAGGRINIGDFDGDGDVELGFAGRNIYTVRNYVDNDGDADPNNGTWSTLWQITGLEYPIVADVNGDGTAEIVVTAQALNGPRFSGTGWISVYESSNQPWVPARNVWNQHGYNVTNINNDLTVPQFQQDNLNPALGQRYNNFLVQTAVGGGPDGEVVFPAADAIILVALDGNGDPDILSVNDPGFPPADLPFEDSDFPLTGTAECDYTNNLNQIGNVRCGEVCDDGMDNDGDGIIDEPNLIQTQNTGCPGEVLNAITNDSPGGTYSVRTGNTPGSNIGTTVDANGVVTLGNNFTGVPVTETIRYDDGICTEEVMVTTVDDVDPSIMCPGNAIVAMDENCSQAIADYAALAQVSDNCTATNLIMVSQAPAVGSNLNLGANTVTMTATDQSGNAASCTFTVTAVDQIAPEIICPADAEVALDDNCQYTIPDLTGGAMVTDNCSVPGSISLAQTPVQGQVRNGDGTTVMVTLTATDEAGNTGNCTYTLTLADETPPVITCPTVGEQTLSNGPDGTCSFSLFDYRNQVQRQDNCSGFNQITLTQSPPGGTVITEPGTTIITITATDAAGNVSTCTIEQAVLDRDPPQLICGQFAPITPNLGTCDYTVPDVIAATTIVDNCGTTPARP